MPPADRPSDTETGVDLGRRLAPGARIAGRYRVSALVGMGGMGAVYKARDEELGIDVALKVLRPDLGDDPQWIERFRRELILAREVSHRNVVRIHDISEADGLRFLTMRYVEGRSLLQVLGEGPLPVERALRIFRQLADALGAAHEAGVVHRDIKPGNVLLENDDTAYITDFGIARGLDAGGLTRQGVVVGTPDYLSPEQVCGDPVDGRSDLYALGIVLYEMLSGRLPFRAETRAESMAQRISGRLRDINETGVKVPAWVRSVLGRCLERSPERRYQTAGELLADLDARSAASGRHRPRAMLVAAAGLGVAALAIALWATSDRAPARTAPPVAARPETKAATTRAEHAIAVLPMADDTADAALAWAATGIPEMLAAQLSESPDLRVLDVQRVLRTLRDLKLAEGRYDGTALSRIAELLEVDRLVTGSVRRAGEAVRLDVVLVDVGPTGTLSSRHLTAEGAGRDGLFGMVGKLGGDLGRALGAARPVTEPGTQPGTSSVDAARAYREGRDHLLVGDTVRAAPAFERAVAADPGFAAALERLAETYQSLGYQDRALSAAKRAAQAVGAAETRIAYRIRARLALLNGNPAGAETTYAELQRRYPNDVETRLDLAAAQAGRGDIARAMETLKGAAALDRNDPRVWYLLGKNAILAGDSARAASDYLVRALALQSQVRNEQGQADTLNALGIAHHELGDYAKAVTEFTQASEARRRLGDDRGLAASLKNRARTAVAQGRADAAAPDLDAAKEILQRIGDPAGLAEVEDEYGSLHEGRGDYPKALKAYQEALRIRRGLGDELQLAQSYDNVGFIYFQMGEYENALAYFQHALDGRQKLGDRSGLVLSTQSMGFIQTALGRWTEATKSFLDALQASRELDYKTGIAVSLANLGVLQQHEGRYAAALSSYREASDLYGALSSKRGLAEVTLKEAAALMDLGRLEDVEEKLRAAGTLIRETGDREQSADRGVLLGQWHARRGEEDAARRAFAEAVKDALASKGRAVILRARLGQAEGHVTLGDVPAALAILGPAAREAESLGEALSRIRAAESTARARALSGRTREAEGEIRAALRLAERCGYGAGLYRIHALLGRILEAKGDVAGSAAAYREAAEGLARLRGGLDPELRRSFDGQPAVLDVVRRAGETAGGS